MVALTDLGETDRNITIRETSTKICWTWKIIGCQGPKILTPKGKRVGKLTVSAVYKFLNILVYIDEIFKWNTHALWHSGQEQTMDAVVAPEDQVSYGCHGHHSWIHSLLTMTSTHVTLLHFSECVLGQALSPWKALEWSHCKHKVGKTNSLHDVLFWPSTILLRSRKFTWNFIYISLEDWPKLTAGSSIHTPWSLFTCCADSLICPEPAGIWRKANSFQFCP